MSDADEDGVHVPQAGTAGGGPREQKTQSATAGLSLRVRRIPSHEPGATMLIASAVVIGMIHLERLRFDIPAGRAAQTINLWSRQADVQVLYDWSTLSTRPTPAVRCLCTPARALSLLLGPLALTFQWVNPKTIDVTRIPMCAPNADEPPPPPCFAGTIL